MFFLTKQEKLILLILGWVLLCGSMVNWALKKYPQLSKGVDLLEADNLYPKIDINTASVDELVAVPYIGTYTAETIVNYRQHKGTIDSLDELKNLPGIKAKNFEKFSPYLTVSQKPDWWGG